MRIILALALGFTAMAAVQSSAPPDVLNVDEAAALLRVKPAVILELAETGQIPARRVGREWRFWRAALLEWLKGETRLAPAELDELRGRGAARAQSTAQPKPQPQQGPPPTVGERPPTPTSEEIALRDQRVLLRRGHGTIDFEASYGRNEQTLLPVVRVEDRAAGVSGTLRYGLLNDFQVTLRAPATWRRVATFTDASIGGTTAPRIQREAIGGDISVSLLGVAWREAAGRPTIIWSVDSVLPTGTGNRGFGGGFVLSKSYDPAVLFAGISYLHGLSVNSSDSESRFSLAKHNYGAQAGYTYAINDSLALSTALVGVYRNWRSPDGVSIAPPRENYALQLGVTWLAVRGLFVEPAVAMRLGGDSPGLTFSLNFSRSFRLMGKR